MAGKTKGELTKERIVEKAVELAHKHGFERTTLADVAEAANVRKGNFYYYFKTKEELGRAVIESQKELIRSKIEEWKRLSDDPAQRIIGFLKYIIGDCEALAAHGCPTGGLSYEIAKLDTAMLNEVGGIFKVTLSWLEKEFKSMGRGAKAKKDALHIFTTVQGVILVGNTLQDKSVIRSQVNVLINEIKSMKPSKACS